MAGRQDHSKHRDLNRPDMHLVLAGSADQSTAAAIDKQIRSISITHRVSRIGYVDSSDLPLLYSMAQAFVFPSHDEVFGLRDAFFDHLSQSSFVFFLCTGFGLPVLPNA